MKSNATGAGKDDEPLVSASLLRREWELFRAQRIPHCGYGVVATKRIRAGTLIVRDALPVHSEWFPASERFPTNAFVDIASQWLTRTAAEQRFNNSSHRAGYTALTPFELSPVTAGSATEEWACGVAMRINNPSDPYGTPHAEWIRALAIAKLAAVVQYHTPPPPPPLTAAESALRSKKPKSASTVVPPTPLKRLEFVPMLSLLNHSCSPNAIRFASQPAVYALTDIEPGEQITICYRPVDICRPTLQRWAGLGFVCQCMRCQLSVDRRTTAGDDQTRTATEIDSKQSAKAAASKSLKSTSSVDGMDAGLIALLQLHYANAENWLETAAEAPALTAVDRAEIEREFVAALNAATNSAAAAASAAAGLGVDAKDGSSVAGVSSRGNRALAFVLRWLTSLGPMHWMILAAREILIAEFEPIATSSHHPNAMACAEVVCTHIAAILTAQHHLFTVPLLTPDARAYRHRSLCAPTNLPLLIGSYRYVEVFVSASLVLHRNGRQTPITAALVRKAFHRLPASAVAMYRRLQRSFGSLTAVPIPVNVHSATSIRQLSSLQPLTPQPIPECEFQLKSRHITPERRFSSSTLWLIIFICTVIIAVLAYRINKRRIAINGFQSSSAADNVIGAASASATDAGARLEL